jgi:hypothetical protein
MTIKIKPQWEKVRCSSTFPNVNSVWTLKKTFFNDSAWINIQGHFRKGCILEAMKRYDDVCILYNW